MKTQHTHGPWRVALSSNKKNGTGWRDIVSDGTEQDAFLIVAAPVMFAALQRIRDGMADDRAYRDAARAAIAEVEGRP